jgi:radical SAM protein with 4Fe4S-binding SPASM domain
MLKLAQMLASLADGISRRLQTGSATRERYLKVDKASLPPTPNIIAAGHPGATQTSLFEDVASISLFDVVLIETHNRCTRRCWFCKFGQERQDPERQDMSDEMLLQLANNLQELEFAGRISPFGINEPLIEPRIINIIKLFRTKCPKAFLSMNTNGDRLNEQLLQQLFEAGLDALGISIYDDLGMKRLAAYGQDSRIALIDMRQPDQKIENRGGEIKVNGDRFPADYFTLSSCSRPFNMLIIRPTGNVVLCCSDMYGDVVMGNVSESRLEDIWNSEAFTHYRQELRTQGRTNLRLCQDCSHDGTTSQVYYPVQPQAVPIATQ